MLPATEATLNASTTPPPATTRSDEYEVEAITMQSNSPNIDSQRSSPFVSCIADTSKGDQENISPSKARHSRVLSGTELSPLKIVAEHNKPRNEEGAVNSDMAPAARSPRKLSPVKRFPVKVSNPIGEAQAQAMSLDDAVRQNKDLKHAIEIFEDDQSMDEADGVDGMDQEDDEPAGPDDTMISTFSTFSAVPSMTMFAKIGQSPTKLSHAGGLTPRGRSDRSPSQTPRPSRESGNTANLLIDFTDQMRFPQRSPLKHGGMNTIGATPSRRLSNLIDFDIPPMPTPRSVPSITARELESLKSQFLSEISSLKASLSGKEAEVQSLKTAVGDAEKRVGNSLEQLREEQSAKEQLAAEKQDWENRGREMESVLHKIKEEILASEREREELEQKLDESEKRREAAEMLHQEAESKMAGMRAGRDSDKSSSSSSSPEKAKSPGTNHEVEVAVERVARELHGLYKGKHETKVAALKKSYESRWQKKVNELEARLEELAGENKKLRAGRCATAPTKATGPEADQLKVQAVKDSAAIKELHADIERLEAVVSTVQRDNTDLRGMLERERVEKGELVQLAEEMMSMQSFIGAQSNPQQQQQQQRQPPPTPNAQGSSQRHHHQPDRLEMPPAKTPRTSSTDNPRSRGSGLRAPGSALRAQHERTRSGGLPRPGAVPRSGIMSSIEKMGNYRGRVAD
jgi:hypothetical protein